MDALNATMRVKGAARYLQILSSSATCQRKHCGHSEFDEVSTQHYASLRVQTELREVVQRASPLLHRRSTSH
ncbi:hypothetical protein MES4922_10076 [Mesorhizobium ventifaucium]|uniref:Uncharacterized protein n=1 Tax=Mesorhizobium ventifaucium TaxID=666020 RepID=A0ABM9DCB7_9HYPH|nr:hypothetical protein MES4922_10076 [Mesorhizobium ventifaucium]